MGYITIDEKKQGDAISASEIRNRGFCTFKLKIEGDKVTAITCTK